MTRRDIPHPGAQLRLTDHHGRRITCSPPTPPSSHLPTSSCGTAAGAWVADRIRCARDTGLSNVLLHDAASNAVWVAIVVLACDLLTWTQTLALTGPLPAAEPQRCGSG